MNNYENNACCGEIKPIQRAPLHELMLKAEGTGKDALGIAKEIRTFLFGKCPQCETTQKEKDSFIDAMENHCCDLCELFEVLLEIQNCLCCSR